MEYTMRNDPLVLALRAAQRLIKKKENEESLKRIITANRIRKGASQYYVGR